MKNVKIWSIIGIVSMCLIITLFYNWDTTIGSLSVFQEQTEDKNDWVVIQSIKDSLSVIKITYQEKYGIEKSAYCMVVFENVKTAEYKCIAPWLGSLLLQKSNLNSFQTSMVSKSEMK
jgi:hypothetical protein